MDKLYIIKNMTGLQLTLNLCENATPEKTIVVSCRATTSYKMSDAEAAYVKSKYKGSVSIVESI